MRSKVFVLLAALSVAACESPTHSNIDKWRGTDKGPARLASAVGDHALDPDLRAHAAQALVAIGRLDDAIAQVSKLGDSDREAVLGKLVPRLWDDCKLTDELQKPTEKQIAAKDSLFSLREGAGPATRETIDGYLVDWLAGYYEGRAPLGLHSGEKILRTIGSRAAPKLLAAGRKVLSDPGTATAVAQFTDELLKGIAVSDTPDTVAFLLDLAVKPAVDESLPMRALGALYQVYVLDPTPAPPVPPALVPHVGRLEAIAASTSQQGENVNVAFDLLAATGPKHCLGPFATLARHEEEPRRWRAVQYGLKCAGADAVVPMAEALPVGAYQGEILQKYFWDKIVDVGPQVADPARKLLASKSWVARVTGISVLGRVGGAADLAALRSLAGDKTRAKGWWGKETAATRKKAEPTVGEIAAEAANRLEKKL